MPLPINVKKFSSVTLFLQLNVSHLEYFEKDKTYKFLCLDRNYMDFITEMGNHKSWEVLKPSEMFKHNYILEYIHSKGTKGMARFYSLNEKGKEISFPKNGFVPFEWDIEYTKGYWFPLQNGYIKPIIEEGEIIEVPNKSFMMKHLEEFKSKKGVNYKDINMVKTNRNEDGERLPRIGWRGPVIPLNLIDLAPDVYYVDWFDEEKIDNKYMKEVNNFLRED